MVVARLVADGFFLPEWKQELTETSVMSLFTHHKNEKFKNKNGDSSSGQGGDVLPPVVVECSFTLFALTIDVRINICPFKMS